MMPSSALGSGHQSFQYSDNNNNLKQSDMSNTKIPGLSFSWKRALGITKVKREISKATGIPTSKTGIERKIGGMIVNAIFKKK